jgi:hypothetical protein
MKIPIFSDVDLNDLGIDIMPENRLHEKISFPPI